jgi:hypothetical protein
MNASGCCPSSNRIAKQYRTATILQKGARLRPISKYACIAKSLFRPECLSMIRSLFAVPLCALLLASGALVTRAQANEAALAAYLDGKASDATVISCASATQRSDWKTIEVIEMLAATPEQAAEDVARHRASEGPLRGAYHQLGVQRFGEADFAARITAYEAKARKADRKFDRKKLREISAELSACADPTDT